MKQKIFLPCPDFAQDRGIKYQVNWNEDGKPCFYRRVTLERASADFHALRKQGHDPFIVDAFTGESIPPLVETDR